MLRLGVGQMEPVVHDQDGNMEKMRELLSSAAKENVDVLVLPELLNSGYFFENQEEAIEMSEEIPGGQFSIELKKWSKKNRMVVAGIDEKTEEGLYNSAAVFGNGKHLATYRKIHLFDAEKLWFLPGEEVSPILNFKNYRFGVIICYDWAFPELSRILALNGAQVILHPANLLLSYCPRAMITRSIENWIFTATASRIGVERGTKFLGFSQVTDPRGHILLQMDASEHGVAWVDVDPAVADEKKITKRNNVLKDRRPELYGPLAKIIPKE